ncbi:MAG: HNH endonuclease, partial [Spiribacter salinus]
RTDAAIPSYLGLIPLIFFRYHHPKTWSNAKGIDLYVLRTLLAGAFSGTPDTVIDALTRHFSEKGEFNLREVFGIIREQGRSLEFSREYLFGLCYGDKELHLIFNLWYRDFNYQPSYERSLPQVDHIFSQSELRKVKRINPETGVRNLLRYYKEDRDQVANCMLLTAAENGAGGKGDSTPAEWFADKDDDYLDRHLIPKDTSLWELDRYEDFVEERQKLILDKFSDMLFSEDDGDVDE